MHSFLPCPPSYLTAESEPFSSDRVRPPLHPSDTLTIYAVISVLLSVLPRCMIRGISVHPRPNPAASIESHPTPLERRGTAEIFAPARPTVTFFTAFRTHSFACIVTKNLFILRCYLRYIFFVWIFVTGSFRKYT